jgi:RNA polymerase sigma-70 factor (ECF subfamily)
VEELSYQEISEIINCPMGTVASRLYRGHSLLREQLREYARQRGVVKE